jgi:hypothetical protein
VSAKRTWLCRRQLCFPGWGYDNAVGGFPNQWNAIFKGSPLYGVTAHVLRHNFASMANDLGYTEITEIPMATTPIPARALGSGLITLHRFTVDFLGMVG